MEIAFQTSSKVVSLCGSKLWECNVAAVGGHAPEMMSVLGVAEMSKILYSDGEEHGWQMAGFSGRGDGGGTGSRKGQTGVGIIMGETGKLLYIGVYCSMCTHAHDCSGGPSASMEKLRASTQYW